jgi:hypothetical protein
VAQTVDNSPEAILAQVQDTLRQIRASGRSEVNAVALGSVGAAAADGAWRDDSLYVDVFTRSGKLRVDVGSDISTGAGVYLSYGYRIYTVSADGLYETLTVEAALDRAISVQSSAGSAYLAASRATRVSGLTPGQYRVRGAIRQLNAGAGGLSARQLTAVPR